jgi:hypothetical protein
MATYSYNFPVIITAQGLQPQTPASLLSQLTSNVALTNPGYTNNLPGSLIEDVASTDVGAIALCDQAKVDLVNSLTPNGANEPLLIQIGQVVGVPQGGASAVSVALAFSGSTAGFLVSQGWIFSDGTNSYALQSTIAIATDGTGFGTAIALNTAQTVAPAANTVTQSRTSIPPGIALNVTNPSAGTPAQAPESFESYRVAVLQANLAASVGTARFIKTLVGQLVPLGVVRRLIGVQQGSPGIKVLVGGSGDPYQIANAILQSVGDPSDLIGKSGGGTNVTVSLNDYPDPYTVVYVSPGVQTVTMTITWNTSLSSFTGGAAFPSLIQPVIAAYINQLIVGQPINLLEMTNIVQSAIASTLDPNLLTRLVFTVSINGSGVSPPTGYQDIPGDSESYFTCVASGITVTQG